MSEHAPVRERQSFRSGATRLRIAGEIHSGPADVGRSD